ncbi:MAG: dTMP kinase [Tepidanaerobacteraceae bacterium]|nr:dTMP kinase [Tepidanaerobacteraceae bacterium]
MKGKFITIEGPDGAGKTTQVRKIAQYLKSAGKNVLITREPGGTAFGEKLRDTLLSPGIESPVPEAEALIYAASRAQLIKKVIAPALLGGTHVLCDRFVDSSLAYQGWARGLGIQTIMEINSWFIQDWWPDITILLDVDPALSISRLNRARDRLERETMDFHKRVREGFLKVRDMFPERIVTVDASESPEKVFNAIIGVIKNIL